MAMAMLPSPEDEAMESTSNSGEDEHTIIRITKQEVETVHLTWVIADYQPSMLGRNGDHIYSPLFTDPRSPNTLWRLELCRYDSRPNPDLSIFLRLICRREEIKIMNCEICIVNENNQTLHMKTYEEPIRVVEIGMAVGFFGYINANAFMQNLDKYICNGNLTITCNIFVIEKIVNLDKVVNYSPITIPECQLGEDLEMMLYYPATTDVVLQIDSSEFGCHKAILIARSPVFAAMLENDMREKKQNRIEIIGMDVDTFKEMIRYIYTDKVKDLENSAFHLLYAADQYGLDRLKVICEIQMFRSLSIENAVYVMMAADELRCARLKREAQKFICRNMILVGRTKSWRDLANKNFALMNELIQFCSECFSSNNRNTAPTNRCRYEI